MTIKNYFTIGICSTIAAYAIGFLKFGTAEKTIATADIPWIAACYVFGIIGSLSILVAWAVPQPRCMALAWPVLSPLRGEKDSSFN
jgi:hypothetical protein